MNVHPSATLIHPEPSTAQPFAPDGLYEIKIDTNGGGVADIAYRVRVSVSSDGLEIATLRRVKGIAAAQTGDGGVIVIDRAPISRGTHAQVTGAGDFRFFAGWRSEPFFFDTLGAVNNLQFTGADFFLDKDVCAIVLEVPNSEFGSKKVGLWARTLDERGENWVQVERVARAQQAVFLPGAERDAYLAGEPADDVRFILVFAHASEHTGGYRPDEAERVCRNIAARHPTV